LKVGGLLFKCEPLTFENQPLSFKKITLPRHQVRGISSLSMPLSYIKEALIAPQTCLDRADEMPLKFAKPAADFSKRGPLKFLVDSFLIFCFVFHTQQIQPAFPAIFPLEGARPHGAHNPIGQEDHDQHEDNAIDQGPARTEPSFEPITQQLHDRGLNAISLAENNPQMEVTILDLPAAQQICEET